MRSDVTEILENLFFIQRGYLNGNHFVFRSEEPVLIDTGYLSYFEDTERLIRYVGVDPAKVRMIVNTHTHCDHVGGNRLIQEQSGCDVALHRYGKAIIDARDDWATWWRYYHQEADFFRCTHALEDGDTVCVGPHRFEVLYTPGHASDGIVLYNRKEKTLISSDTLWEKDTAVITSRVEGSLAPFHMRESLERLRGLEVDRIYPGHGQPFTDFEEAVETAVQRVERALSDPTRLGMDVLKKIIVFTLLMLRGAQEDAFFPHLMETVWYKETVELYFHGKYESMYREIMEDFLRRGIVRREGSRILAGVNP